MAKKPPKKRPSNPEDDARKAEEQAKAARKKARKEKKDRIIPLWYTAVFKKAIKDKSDKDGILASLDIKRSNFIEDDSTIQVSLFGPPFKKVKKGAILRITYFAASNKISISGEGKMSVKEESVKYEVMGPDGWELIFEGI